jgi:uncharacterized repeat protein (TIGR03803 family)
MRLQAMILTAALAIAGTASATGAETVLHSFAGGSDGSYPVAALIDKAGNMYGTTRYGGANGSGIVFKLEKSGGVWNESVIYSFGGGNDGSSPAASLVMDGAGNLYGTTRLGGPANAGTVFEVSPSGSSWTESVLYAFTGGSDGGAPQAALVLRGGALYGTTPQGGAKGNGTVFELTPADGTWQEKVLYSFAGGSSDGEYPYCAVIFDKYGNMYGTAESGGPNQEGAVFELIPAGKSWREKILYFFTGNLDGGTLDAGVIFDPAGNLYGLTVSGGKYSSGTVFELKPVHGAWKEHVLYNFTGGQDGGFPSGGLVRSKSGTLYSTAFNGGAYGYGTVFKVARSAGNWTETVLYNFTGGDDGALPLAGLLLRGGHLFGTTVEGGTAQVGVAFELE